MKIGMTFMESNLAMYTKIIIMNNSVVIILPLLKIIPRKQQRLPKDFYKALFI